MKNRFIILLIICTWVFISCNNTDKSVTRRNSFSFKGNINVVCDPRYDGLVKKWAEGFRNQYPSVTFSYSKASREANLAAMVKDNLIGFYSDDAFTGSGKFWRLTVARNALLPIINKQNPCLKVLLAKGFSTDVLSMLFSSASPSTWGNACGTSSSDIVNVYVLKSAANNVTLAKFLSISPMMLKGVFVDSEEEMLQKVQADIHGIAFCGLTNVFDLGTGQKMDKIEVLPIDRNRNGKIDYVENNFTDLQTFLRAMWIGKFPGALAQNIYVVCNVKPKDSQSVQFLKWLLTDGQQLIPNNGYCQLVNSELSGKIAQLN